MGRQQVDFYKLFDRVVVITLFDREDRWFDFMRRLPSDWPFRPPLRFMARDGRKMTIPVWWTAGEGAWGCYQSHTAILEDCINDGIESVLILEDDALFLPNFVADWNAFFNQLPSDWQYLYLGGQHIELESGLPQAVSEWVYRPFNVNRAHAYAVKGRPMIKRILNHLHDTKNWKADHHFDHHLGELHKKMNTGLYAPKQWLIGQTGGMSNINLKSQPPRKFRGAVEVLNPQVDMQFIAVLGPYCCGANLVAGALHHLGVSMGIAHHTSGTAEPHAAYECSSLTRLCKRLFQEPWLLEQLPFDKRVLLLRIWASDRCEEIRDKRQIVGGNHAMLSLLGRELEVAWNQPKFILVDHQPEAVLDTLATRRWGWPLEACIQVTRVLQEECDRFRNTTQCSTLTIPYASLKSDSESVVTQICEFLEYTPSPQSILNAKQFLDQE